MHNSQPASNARRQLTVIASPLVIIATNFMNAFFFGQMIGRWAFIPIILVEWGWFAFFINKYGRSVSLRNWLGQSTGGLGGVIPAMIVAFIPLPIFWVHRELLAHWSIWLPWITLALINPWLEEFYWRGLLMDYTARRNKWAAILFSSVFFAGNHAAFGVNSVLFRGPETLLVTFVMGLVWAWTYHKTGSLKWTIFSHFLVDFFNLSVPSFLDLYTAGR